MTDDVKQIPGQGIVQWVQQTKVRVECDNCGENATKRHTYLLANARHNPKSSGYHRNELIWCSDKEAFCCNECKQPEFQGYDWGGTFSICERFSHMFLRWKERKYSEAEFEKEFVRKETV